MQSCECEIQARKRRSRRITMQRLQMSLPFPPQIVVVPKRQSPTLATLQRQPAKFPHEWWRLARRDGPNWRWMYQQRWIDARKAQGLPFVINEPAQKIPAQSVEPEGQCSSWKALHPQQMTAGRAGNQTEAAA